MRVRFEIENRKITDRKMKEQTSGHFPVLGASVAEFFIIQGPAQWDEGPYCKRSGFFARCANVVVRKATESYSQQKSKKHRGAENTEKASV